MVVKTAKRLGFNGYKICARPCSLPRPAERRLHQDVTP